MGLEEFKGTVFGVVVASALYLVAIVKDGNDRFVTSAECEAGGGVVLALSSAEVPAVVCMHKGKYWKVDARGGE